MVTPIKRQQCLGLLFYNELLHIFYRLRICDYKNAGAHVERLDAAMKADLQQMQHVQQLGRELNAVNQSLSRFDLHHRERSALSEKQARLQHQLSSLSTWSSTAPGSLEPAYFGNMKRTYGDKLELAPPPLDGEWLPKSAVYALVDLMVVALSRPKGNFKDSGKRIQSGIQTIQGFLFTPFIFVGREGGRGINMSFYEPLTNGDTHFNLNYFGFLFPSFFFSEELVKLGITDGVRGKFTLRWL